MGFSDEDRAFMQRALVLAEQGKGRVEPNPMVGAVVVKEGRVVGEGCYTEFGGRHAEVFALERSGEAAKGARLYVTLEPCDHVGKTAACAPVVAQAGLKRVVVAAADPTAVQQGSAAELIASRGVSVEMGCCWQDAVRLNAGFFKLAAVGRPLVIAKWAMSADGKIATAAGSSRWISSAEARRLVHRLRGQVDCIIIGGRTALRDDPLLTCRDAERRRVATRLVVCGAAVPPADSQLARTVSQAPVLLAYHAENPPAGLGKLVQLGCEPLLVEGGLPGRVSLEKLLDELGHRRMTNVLVEGGGELLGAFFDAGLVDRAMAFVCPVVVGGADATTPVAGRGAARVADAMKLMECETRVVGPDVLIQGWAVDPLAWSPQSPMGIDL
ncbi:MAG: bifunctional diaminohydroxyphosphoribosylaminopyrimidine deaminase/5-amino-6-(5-phosphoribosylamino)uracil reductase RibD [Planctomycetota bacterium]